MKFTVIIFTTMSTVLLSHLILVHSFPAPTPKPAFPFTTLPEKGEGHRKIAGLKRKGLKRKFLRKSIKINFFSQHSAHLDYFSFAIFKSLLIDEKHRYVPPKNANSIG